MITQSVKRLPVENGVSGWEAISKRSFPVRCLDGNVTADWLIIGAGFAGLSAARRLLELRPDDKIVILDASEVGKGASGRNSGFMIDVPHNLSSGEYSSGSVDDTRIEMAQNRSAIAFATHAAAEYGMSRETFDPSGKINAAATSRGMKLNTSFGESLRSAGEKHTFLDASQMREITGTDFYLGGIYTPGAVLIQPADYVREFAAGLSRNVDIFERTPRHVFKARERCVDGSVTARERVCAKGHIGRQRPYQRLRSFQRSPHALLRICLDDRSVPCGRFRARSQWA